MELANMLEEDPDPDVDTADASAADDNPDLSTEATEQPMTADAQLAEQVEAEPQHDFIADVDDTDDADGDLAGELLRSALQQQQQQQQQAASAAGTEAVTAAVAVPVRQLETGTDEGMA